MKKYFKKVLAVLLIATSFNILPIIGKTSNDILTYAENNTEQNQDIERIGYYVWVKDTPFCIENKIYDENPELYSTSSLNQLLQKAKDKIYETLGLNYPDELQIKIYVKEKLNGTSPGYYCPDSGKIKIRKDRLFDERVLPHEMTHALLHHFLGEHYDDLNLGINEGFATQTQKLGERGSPFDISNLNDKFFLDDYSSDRKERFGFYALHQYIVYDWIKSEGKEVVKKFIEKVKDGEDSVQAFLDLGGDKIVQKYKEKFKYKKILKYALLIPKTIFGVVSKTFAFMHKAYNKVKDFFKTSNEKERSINTHAAL